jgi:hypothetical protein
MNDQARSQARFKIEPKDPAAAEGAFRVEHDAAGGEPSIHEQELIGAFNAVIATLEEIGAGGHQKLTSLWDRVRELVQASLVHRSIETAKLQDELKKIESDIDQYRANLRSKIIFEIKQIREDITTDTPKHFRIEWKSPVDQPNEIMTKAERELVDAFMKEIDRVTENKAREHPSRDEWLDAIEELARLCLIEKRNNIVITGIKLCALGEDIKFALDRFSKAPFRVNLEKQSYIIEIERVAGTQPPSVDQEAFVNEFDQAEHFLETLYSPSPSLGVHPPKEEKDRIWRRLTNAARLALADPRPNLSIARSALTGILRDAIRDRGPDYRKGYLTGLWQSYVIVLVGVAASLILFHWFAHHGEFLGDDRCRQWIGGSCWTLPQAMRVSGDRLIFFATSLGSLAVGAWLSACARLDTNSPEVLTAMISTDTNPTLYRAVMVLGFGAVALILLHTGIVVVEIGGASSAAGAAPPQGATSLVFDSKQALTDLSTCILVGIFLGLGERTLPATVNQRATAFVAGLGGAGASAPR